MEKRNKWLEDRPFLGELGAIHRIMEDTLAACAIHTTPDWDQLSTMLKKGEPLLASGFIDIEKSARCLEALAALHDNTLLPAPFREQCKQLDTQLKADPSLAVKLVTGQEASESEGIAAFFVHLAIRELLRPHQAMLTEKLDEAGWQEGYCPTCGGHPVTAQLKKTTKGRIRYLVCGTCHTKWHYKRIGCPFCGDSDQEHMAILEAEGEHEMRIDICESCKSYLKTYTSEGMEDIALNDWASLHLDAACRGMGYAKHGAVLLME